MQKWKFLIQKGRDKAKEFLGENPELLKRLFNVMYDELPNVKKK